MNNLAFQIYGTKKATPFQSVWDTTKVSAVGSNFANRTASSLPTDWSGTDLSVGGYTHNGSGSNTLPFAFSPPEGQSYQITCALSSGSTGSVVINLGGVSSVAISTTTTITLTTTTIGTLSITPVSFIGNVSLTIRQSSSEANQIQLPINSIPVGKSIWVDWGDGQYSTMNNSNIVANRIHTYAASGEYPVRVFGDNFAFGFGNGGFNDRLKIKSISSWGKLKLQSFSFNGCSKVTMSGITDIPDLTGVTTLSYTFSFCALLTTIGRINEWNTSSVTNMSNMFNGSPLFNDNIGSWNVSSVTTMADMFNGASNFNQPIGNWERVSSPDTSTLLNCTSAFALFKAASAFNQPIGNWNVSGVTNMLEMFNGASNFNNGFASGIANQLSWTINTAAASVSMASMFSGAIRFNSNLGTGTTPWNVSKVTTFANMFNGASNFNNGDDTAPINNWVINTTAASVLMNGMFQNTPVFNQNIGNWDVSKVTTTNSMFQGASAFNQPLANWERSTVGNISTMGKVTSMSNMFSGASTFNQPIGSWNISNVTNMASMFGNNMAFNQPLANWERSTPGNTSTLANVITMNNMFGGGFGGTRQFNQDIGSWNVSKVTDFTQFFGTGNSINLFNNGGSPSINNWSINTLQPVSFVQMFNRCTNFNQPLNSWNTSEVISMSAMFANSAFNNGLPSGTSGALAWNTGKVTAMAGMFNNNLMFNCNIGSWNVSQVTTFESMFNGASSFTNGLNTAPINNWNIGGSVTGTISMLSMFRNATAFNQPIGSWNVSNVTNMESMFNNAYAFNQDIGSWNVSNVISFNSFMTGKTNLNFSSTNLDAIYNGWIVNGVKPNVSSPLSTNISFGTAKYTAVGTPGRLTLTSAPNNWIIQDGGITA